MLMDKKKTRQEKGEPDPHVGIIALLIITRPRTATRSCARASGLVRAHARQARLPRHPRRRGRSTETTTSVYDGAGVVSSSENNGYDLVVSRDNGLIFSLLYLSFTSSKILRDAA
jgi:hypothetical protein